MKFKSSIEAFNYIESFTNLERNTASFSSEYKLERIKLLCRMFDNPQNNFKAIHIAGSKGKGSTAAFTASILSANGFKTGLYCSPHVTTYKERISLAGQFFDEEIYVETISEMITLVNSEISSGSFPSGPPTVFELLTLLSFLIFKKTNCSWAVFETGIGGRLDTTNILSPEACILTLIELEHTEILGNTITEIAGEKAGIIKEGKPVFSARQTQDAVKVFREKAKVLSSKIFFPEDFAPYLKKTKPSKGFLQSGIINLFSEEELCFNLKIPGSFQLENASLAISCLYYLSQKTNILPDNFNCTLGLEKTSL
ncbi:MAG: Mur ligase family protein, partial [Spirochaetales bacterium]|nr:Mur ligase family protein [Spirochaetales bacterium]